MTAFERRMRGLEEGLSPFAVRSYETRGRVRPEEESAVRTPFQRDRDRIIHTKSFRRLMHKTQVFIAPQGDHYRTRLTHTLEVTQIARTIGRALRLNEDLIEAIGMGHDLGHTPFGHAGERALAEMLPGFRHNEQSLRVVEFLENGGMGLNLTEPVRSGILRLLGVPDGQGGWLGRLRNAHWAVLVVAEGRWVLESCNASAPEPVEDAVRGQDRGVD